MKPVKNIPPEPRLQQLHDQQFATLNQLAAGIAHEFNNLIAGILGSAEIIALDLPEKHPARESLDHIFEATHRARDFVLKLRELAQRNPTDLKPTRLQAVIEDALPILRTVTGGRVQFHLRLAASCPPVLADAAQMQSAIIELCLQAWHGLPDRTGEITVALEKISLEKKLGLLVSGEHVRLNVRDNGPGLDKHSLAKIFDPFHLRRVNGKKTGLELFLVRETVRAHHGDIIAASEPGRGLAFQLYFPAGPEAA